VPVVIDQVSLSAEPASGAAQSALSGPEGSEAPPGGAPMTEDDFRFFYGSVIRSILREELERAIRSGAD
jgi:hypothetical protein